MMKIIEHHLVTFLIPFDFKKNTYKIEDFNKNLKINKSLLFYNVFFHHSPTLLLKKTGNNFDFNLNDIKSFTGNNSYSNLTKTYFLLQT